MYVGVEEGGVFRSRDSGTTFESLNDGLYDDIHTVVVDPLDSRRVYATTGKGFYRSENAGGSWRRVSKGIDRGYTVPLMVARGGADTIFTAAAAGPPPTWSLGHAGADAMLYRSDDQGQSFSAIPIEHVWGRGMIMRLKADPEGVFLGVTNDGYVIRATEQAATAIAIAENLPPAHDFVTLP